MPPLLRFNGKRRTFLALRAVLRLFISRSIIATRASCAGDKIDARQWAPQALRTGESASDVANSSMPSTSASTDV